ESDSIPAPRAVNKSAVKRSRKIRASPTAARHAIQHRESVSCQLSLLDVQPLCHQCGVHHEQQVAVATRARYKRETKIRLRNIRFQQFGLSIARGREIDASGSGYHDLFTIWKQMRILVPSSLRGSANGFYHAASDVQLLIS